MNASDLVRNDRVEIHSDELPYLVDHVEDTPSGGVLVTYSSGDVIEYAAGDMVTAK